MKTGFRLPITAASIAFASCLATTALAQGFVMKFGTATVNDPQHEYIKIYKEEIEQRSGGRIKVEIYPQSQLGPIPRQLEGLQLGTIEGFIGPADFYVGVDKRFGVFSAPILFRDMTNAAATSADPGTQPGDPRAWFGQGLRRARHVCLCPTRLHGKGSDPYVCRLQGQEDPRQRHAAGTRSDGTAGRDGVANAAQRGPAGAPTQRHRRHSQRPVGLRHAQVPGRLQGRNGHQRYHARSAGDREQGLVRQASSPNLQKAVVDAGRAAQVRNQKFTLDFNAQMPRAAGPRSAGNCSCCRMPDQKLVAALKSVGDDVTKDDPPVKAFFERVRAAAAKN